MMEVMNVTGVKTVGLGRKGHTVGTFLTVILLSFECHEDHKAVTKTRLIWPPSAFRGCLD